MRRATAVLLAAALALGRAPAHGGAPAPQSPSSRVEAAARVHADAAWIAPDADVIAYLTRTPGECLTTPRTNEARYLLEIGRAAFRSPALLAGVAARGGLSCNSCHRDGRSNPAFFLAGVSAEPGTADVTSSLFSKVREDGRFNPVAIPDLVGAAAKSAFGSHGAASLEEFISSAVTEEFGAAAPQSVLAGLVAYVSALDPSACPTQGAAESLGRAMRDAIRAMSAAGQALKRSDSAAADLMLLAAAGELGRVHDRLPTPRFSDSRLALAGLARDLQRLRDVKEQARARSGLNRAKREARRLSRRLQKEEGATLYNPETLAAALALPAREE